MMDASAAQREHGGSIDFSHVPKIVDIVMSEKIEDALDCAR
jgi:hypothetical protein